MVEKNQTAIQILKILYKSIPKKKYVKTHYTPIYPKGLEARYKTLLVSYFKPLIAYVNKILDKNLKSVLRGDSVKFDVIPGARFRQMIETLEGWLGIYMPPAEQVESGKSNIILMGLNNFADQMKDFVSNQFSKQLEKGIGVKFNTEAVWWESVKTYWARNNYKLIVSSARNYVSEINEIIEEAVINGLPMKHIVGEIKKLNESITDKKAKLIARDQCGKLHGQITQAQFEEVGLEMYIWETMQDERVRGNPNGKYPKAKYSHFLMSGLLCRWDDSMVCSYDNGKTWVPRPLGAVTLHPGQDIQCRCFSSVFMPELLDELSY